MTKRTILLLLCTLLLLCSAVPACAAGGADDPMISQSYVENTFLPTAIASLQSIMENAVKDYVARQAETVRRGGLKTMTLRAGDKLYLGSGQQLILISGGVKLNVESGTLLNVTAGRTSTGGDARVGNRYLLAGDGKVTATVNDAAVVTVSPAVIEEKPMQPSGTGDCPFTDVPETAWYYADVVSAYQRGLVNGVTLSTYAPLGTLTASSAVKLAACMHQLYHRGSVTLNNAADGRAWYMTYVDYALQNGLLEAQLPDYDGPISRGEFIKLFFNAMPEGEYARINLIMDGAIPDIATDAPLAKQVYIFYMAGILTGYAEGNGFPEHAFGPDSTITRAEVATIMNRMFDSAARKRFSMD